VRSESAGPFSPYQQQLASRAVYGESRNETRTSRVCLCSMKVVTPHTTKSATHIGLCLRGLCCWPLSSVPSRGRVEKNSSAFERADFFLTVVTAQGGRRSGASCQSNSTRILSLPSTCSYTQDVTNANERYSVILYEGSMVGPLCNCISSWMPQKAGCNPFVVSQHIYSRNP
jgi:hypothetical protein